MASNIIGDENPLNATFNCDDNPSNATFNYSSASDATTDTVVEVSTTLDKTNMAARKPQNTTEESDEDLSFPILGISSMSLLTGAFEDLNLNQPHDETFSYQLGMGDDDGGSLTPNDRIRNTDVYKKIRLVGLSPRREIDESSDEDETKDTEEKDEILTAIIEREDSIENVQIVSEHEAQTDQRQDGSVAMVVSEEKGANDQAPIIKTEILKEHITKSVTIIDSEETMPNVKTETPNKAEAMIVSEEKGANDEAPTVEIETPEKSGNEDATMIVSEKILSDAQVPIIKTEILKEPITKSVTIIDLEETMVNIKTETPNKAEAMIVSEEKGANDEAPTVEIETPEKSGTEDATLIASEETQSKDSLNPETSKSPVRGRISEGYTLATINYPSVADTSKIMEEERQEIAQASPDTASVKVKSYLQYLEMKMELNEMQQDLAKLAHNIRLKERDLLMLRPDKVKTSRFEENNPVEASSQIPKQVELKIAELTTENDQLKKQLENKEKVIKEMEKSEENLKALLRESEIKNQKLQQESHAIKLKAFEIEVVIEALLKDAKRFKSKWELHTNEPCRSKPNLNFLKRTLNNVVKTNEDRMRKPKNLEDIIRKEKEEMHSAKKHRSREHSRRGCSKSKYRCHDSRSRSPRKEKKKKKKKKKSKERSTKK